MKLKPPLLALCCAFMYFASPGQFDTLNKNISLTTAFNSFNQREKIFIHCDRTSYMQNDTLWMKGYMITAQDGVAADSSKIVYIEIINAAGELIKRTSTYCSGGLFLADIKLNESRFEQGSYLLRAYTNYMRNFGDSLFFESWFKVINPAAVEWNILLHQLSITGKRLLLDAALTTDGNETAQQKNITVALRSKNKIVFKQPVTSNEKGRFVIDTLLPGINTANALQLEVSDNENVKIQLPVKANIADKTDLQFLPEGGSFIVGKLQQLGFKALNIFGAGTSVKGHIENSKKQLVATFASVHKGMGTVWLQPEINEQYTAVLPSGLRFPLPLPQASGTLLQVSNLPDADSIVVTVDASPDLYHTDYFFNAAAKGISCARGTVHFKDQPVRIAITKKAFPSGICSFTLYNSASMPVNERAAFIWHRDALQLQLLPHKQVYEQRDSVQLLLTAKKQSGEPVTGSFSIAVIDTAQVQYPLNTENILSYLLLSSDLSGTVEEPAYYLNSPLPGATEALMLTQGWVKYNQFFSTPAFGYEKEFIINGRVTNLLNNPVGKADIAVYAKDGKSSGFLLNTQTDKSGQFTLLNWPVFETDSLSLLIRALNKRGKSFGIGVDVETPQFPEINPHKLPAVQNEILYDTQTAVQLQKKELLYNRLKKEKGYLPEVRVKGKIKIAGSKNLNSDGGADQVINQTALEKTPKESLLQVLTKKVPGFYKGRLPRNPLMAYKRNGDLVIFIIDGYNINKYYEPFSNSPTAFTEYIETYLNYINAEDVAGIEIMTTSKNSMAYESYYELYSSVMITYTFIEITTFSGYGAFNKKVPGMYLYKPVAPVQGKIFYSPRYTTADAAKPDYRTTVYWHPNIITNEKGEAGISFFTSGSGSNCLVVVQGTDLNGGMGAVFMPLAVKEENKKTSQ